LPYDSNSFDKIISLGVIEHFKDPSQSIKEMYRVLKPGGNLILMTPNKLSLGVIDRRIKESLDRWPFGYQTEYAPNQLQKLLENYNFGINKTIGQLRRRLEKDNRSFKLISFSDQFLNLFNKHWGFYSYVFATKDKKVYE
jgi:ubiquinone/menaquinone biosynthesis C-methylase UbiE